MAQIRLYKSFEELYLSYVGKVYYPAKKDSGCAWRINKIIPADNTYKVFIDMLSADLVYLLQAEYRSYLINYFLSFVRNKNIIIDANRRIECLSDLKVNVQD